MTQSQVNTLGEMLLARRLELGLSQKQLADAMQTTRRNIDRWENDQVVPRGHHFWRLLSALSLHLVTAVEDAPKAVSDELRTLSDRINELTLQVTSLHARCGDPPPPR